MLVARSVQSSLIGIADVQPEPLPTPVKVLVEIPAAEVSGMTTLVVVTLQVRGTTVAEALSDISALTEPGLKAIFGVIPGITQSIWAMVPLKEDLPVGTPPPNVTRSAFTVNVNV